MTPKRRLEQRLLYLRADAPITQREPWVERGIMTLMRKAYNMGRRDAANLRKGKS